MIHSDRMEDFVNAVRTGFLALLLLVLLGMEALNISSTGVGVTTTGGGGGGQGGAGGGICLFVAGVLVAVGVRLAPGDPI